MGSKPYETGITQWGRRRLARAAVRRDCVPRLINDTRTVAQHSDAQDAAAYESSTTTMMFKNAATKLSHSSTIRAVAPGDPDLKPLQEVIINLKIVLQSYAHPATDHPSSNPPSQFA